MQHIADAEGIAVAELLQIDWNRNNAPNLLLKTETPALALAMRRRVKVAAVWSAPADPTFRLMLLPRRLSLMCCFAGVGQADLWLLLRRRRLSLLLKTLQRHKIACALADVA